MLTSTLRDLENRGVIIRTQFNEISPHVIYSLSQAGKDLYPIFLEMMRWNDKYPCSPAQNEINKEKEGKGSDKE